MALRNVYWDWTAMERDSVMPSILAIGDSWFWYPFPGGSLINQLGPLVAPMGHSILALGNNGAKAWDYVNGRFRASVDTALRLQGASLSAVFVSGGGNDFAGFNDLRPMLKTDCSQASDAQSCFVSGNQAGSLDDLMHEMDENYQRLIDRIIAATPAACWVVLHNYDVAIPTGHGVFGNQHSWLKPALDAAGVPLGLQRDCVRQVLARFTATLRGVEARTPQRVVLVDSAGTLSESEWANELHPTTAGFRRIAQERWGAVLRGIGVA